MQIELIETFLDLMETKSFNRSAERLGITQSTVSHRINTLESALNRKLFTRNRAGTAPTAAGIRFAEHARSLRHQWQEAYRAVQTAGTFETSMRIGIQHDLTEILAEDWIGAIRRSMPAVSLYIETDYSGQMNLDLVSGDLDLGLIYTPRHLPDLHYTPIGEVEYVMVSTLTDRLDSIVADRYIRANYSPLFHTAHLLMFPQFGSAPVASGQNATITRLLLNLGGSAYVATHSAARMIGAGQCMRVNDAEPIAQTVHVAVNVRHRHSHPHKKIVSLLAGHFRRP